MRRFLVSDLPATLSGMESLLSALCPSMSVILAGCCVMLSDAYRIKGPEIKADVNLGESRVISSEGRKLTLNQLVVGSIPTSPTNHSSKTGPSLGLRHIGEMSPTFPRLADMQPR